MASPIDALMLEIGLDRSKFTTDAKGVEQDLDNMSKAGTATGNELDAAAAKAVQGFQRLRSEIVGLIGLVLAGRGLKALAGDITEADAATGRMAGNLTMSTQELAAWEGAAQRSGGTAEGMAGSMSKLSGEIENFRRTGQGGDAFIPWLNRIHVTLRKASGEFKTMGELFSDINKSAAWQRMTPQERSLVGGNLGMDQGTINTLGQPPAALDATLARQRKLGLPSDDDARRAQQLINDLLDLRQSVMQFARTLLNDAEPALHKLLATLTDLVEKYGPQIATAITAELLKLANALKHVDWKAVGQDIDKFMTGANSAAGAVGGWTKATEDLFELWLGMKFLAVIANVTSLLRVFGLLSPAVAAALATLSLHGDTDPNATPDGFMPGWKPDNGPDAHGPLSPEEQAAIRAQAMASGGVQSYLNFFRHLLGLPEISNAPAITDAQAKANAKQAMDYFIAQGRKPEEAAGILGNLQQESGLNPQAGLGTSHFGIAQWSPERQAEIAKHFGKPLGQMSFMEQIAAVQWELTEGRFRNVNAMLPGAVDQRNAAAMVDRGYEIPSSDDAVLAREDARRGDYATQILNAYRGGNPGAVPTDRRWHVSAAHHTSHSSTEVRIDNLHVHTKATDAKGIAHDIQGALRDQVFASQFNRALV